MFVFIVVYCLSKYKEKTGLSWFRVYFNKGNYGEYKLYRKLIKIFSEENIFVNVYLDNEKTTFTEIDLIAIDNKHVYVFEMKNYKGWIFGSDNQKYWTQTLNRRTKNTFYSPILQNNGHLKALNNLLDKDENIYESVIVFSNNSKFKVSFPYNVIKLKNINKFFNIYNNAPNNVTNEEIKDIKRVLSSKINVDPKIKKQHIKEIEQFNKRR